MWGSLQFQLHMLVLRKQVLPFLVFSERELNSVYTLTRYLTRMTHQDHHQGVLLTIMHAAFRKELTDVAHCDRSAQR